jgi:hypothetical protein
MGYLFMIIKKLHTHEAVKSVPASDFACLFFSQAIKKNYPGQ